MNMNQVSVVGLGSMGMMIARLFLKSGRRVTVWNRSVAKSAHLEGEGAQVGESAAAAFAASPVVVVCVYDYKAAKEILELPDVKEAVLGKTLVQLSTGSPTDARNLQVWAHQNGAKYLDGAIQSAPSQMGQADTPILISGDEVTYASVQGLLADLAGNYVYLGHKIEAAAVMDLATLSYVYGAFAGFIHGAVMAEAAGLGVGQYGKIVADISPSFGAFFAHEAKVIEGGDFTITESPLRISVEATRRIFDISTSMRLNVELPSFVYGLLQRANVAGLGDQEVAALIKVLRVK
jgi:3-hydroxyisobutyrate dehydrogenase-like beta-hydroxyacid dehydrogenase